MRSASNGNSGNEPPPLLPLSLSLRHLAMEPLPDPPNPPQDRAPTNLPALALPALPLSRNSIGTDGTARGSDPQEMSLSVKTLPIIRPRTKPKRKRTRRSASPKLLEVLTLTMILQTRLPLNLLPTPVLQKALILPINSSLNSSKLGTPKPLRTGLLPCKHLPIRKY